MSPVGFPGNQLPGGLVVPNLDKSLEQRVKELEKELAYGEFLPCTPLTVKTAEFNVVARREPHGVIRVAGFFKSNAEIPAGTKMWKNPAGIGDTGVMRHSGLNISSATLLVVVRIEGTFENAQVIPAGNFVEFDGITYTG